MLFKVVITKELYIEGQKQSFKSQVQISLFFSEKSGYILLSIPSVHEYNFLTKDDIHLAQLPRNTPASLVKLCLAILSLIHKPLGGN